MVALLGGPYDELFGSTTSGYDFSGDDLLIGMGGDDIFLASAGDDIIDGGSGVDYVYYDHSGFAPTGVYVNTWDTAQGALAPGTATVFGPNKTDLIDSIEGFVLTGGQDIMYASADVSYVADGAGDDVVYVADGVAPDDPGIFITFGAGADYYQGGGSAFDIVSYAEGTPGSTPPAVGITVTASAPEQLLVIDRYGDQDNLQFIEGINGTANDDTMSGYVYEFTFEVPEQNNRFFGQGGDDTLSGGDGDDMLDGGSGDDVLDGQDDDDTLIGGRGSDTMTGGEGADIFVFAGGAGTAEADAITDFESGIDLIDLSAFGVDPGLARQYAPQAISDTGSALVLDMSRLGEPDGSTVTFEGLSPRDLSLDDFIL